MSLPSGLPSLLYTPQRVRELDRLAIERHGIEGYVLMSRAGECVLREARSRFPSARRWLVLCGAGNNGGDGYVVARLAGAAGLTVTVAALTDPARLQGDAARAWRDFQAQGGATVPFDPGLCANAELVIDAVFGTGLTRPLDGTVRAAVDAVNAAAVPVVAVDVPSGLCAETGRVLGAAIRASLTPTFIGRKQGLYLGAGPELCGTVVFDDLGARLAPMSEVPASMRLFDETDWRRLLPPRSRTAHKGDFGHVLVIGGNRGFAGAARLAGEAALRAGAGLVSVATRPEHVAAIAAGRPELMCRGIETPGDLEPLLARATVIAIGPGLGQDAWAQALFERVRDLPQPLVVDADALNLLAGSGGRNEQWILTPHPGEAARLLGLSTAGVQADRRAALDTLQERYGGIALLKGRCTLVGQRGQLPCVIDAGNPGMASGGMGDVLTGLVAGLVAQCAAEHRFDATACAAWVHAQAADAAAADGGERGLVASDLFARMRPWLNPSN